MNEKLLEKKISKALYGKWNMIDHHKMIFSIEQKDRKTFGRLLLCIALSKEIEFKSVWESGPIANVTVVFERFDLPAPLPEPRVPIDQTTPQLSSVPERTYIRDGNIIKVYEVLSGDTSSSVINGDVAIFTMILKSEEIAMDVMEDLYYGEYTGG